MTEINKLSDSFHNLPNLIYTSQFEEQSFWEQLKISCPDKFETYFEIFERELN